MESRESRIPFHKARHLCKLHRHQSSLNSHEDNLEGSTGCLEKQRGHRACFLCSSMTGWPECPLWQSSRKGCAKGRSHQEHSSSCPQGMHGLGQEFSKCGPWTRSIRNPFRPCPDPLQELWVEPSDLGFNKLSKQFQCSVFDDHCLRR